MPVNLSVGFRTIPRLDLSAGLACWLAARHSIDEMATIRYPEVCNNPIYIEGSRESFIWEGRRLVCRSAAVQDVQPRWPARPRFPPPASRFLRFISASSGDVRRMGVSILFHPKESVSCSLFTPHFGGEG